LTAIVIGAVPAISTALYLVFFCRSRKMENLIHLVIQCIAGIPSIVLGLFSYSLFVRDLNFGRCILSSGIALGIMVLPFIEVRAEKTFRELNPSMIQSAYALGCTKTHTILTVVLPACRGELFSGIILGGCYAMGATAPMIFTGAVAFASNPTSLLKPAMALPLHLYLLVAQGHTSLDMAYGTAFVMMAVILVSNALVTMYARRRQRAWKQ
jgi:phosphate transport system permease protein